jgi:hypothetical protein
MPRRSGNRPPRGRVRRPVADPGPIDGCDGQRYDGSDLGQPDPNPDAGHLPDRDTGPANAGHSVRHRGRAGQP